MDMTTVSSTTTGLQDAESQGLGKREAEILSDYSRWRDQRRPFEGPWFVNGAMLRGQQHVLYDDALAKLVSPIAPSYRIRLNINRIRPKIKARLAKFFKNRPKPVVIPASTERKDILNARFTEKALTYIWYKQHLEEKYKDARMWATIASKGLLWIRWDDNINGRIRQDQTDPMTGQSVPGKFTDTSAPIGDVCIEVGSPFELLVADPTISRLGAQPKIIRARYINVKDAQARYPQFEKDPPATGEKLSQYKDLLATLYPRTESVATGMPTALHADQVIEIEHFTAPTDKFPKGRYAVMVGSKVMRDEDELPYEMWDMPENPYPVVEIVDTVAAGQYWGPTQVEQMVDLQREYNFLRGLLSENIRMMARPKIIVYKQHNLQDGAWCVDEHTDVLTREGWKNYATLAIGEEILGYDPQTSRTRWMVMRDMNVTAYKGRMVRFQNQRIDALVTPNHKWVVEPAQVQAQDKSAQFIETDTLVADSKHKWKIPTDRSGALDGQLLPQSEAFFEVLGWVAGDGCIQHGKYVNITQKKPAGIKALRAVLQASGLRYTEYACGHGGKAKRFYIPVEDSRQIVEFLPEKRPALAWITRASAEQLEAFLRGAIASDGYHSQKYSGQVVFYNCDLELCKRVQTMAALLGRRNSLRLKYAARENRQAAYEVNIGGIKFFEERKSKKSVDTRMASIEVSNEQYDGLVWCPSVETGAAVFRRNNRIYISGNTNAAGEIVELNWMPGLPDPRIIQPANVAGDVWNLLALISREFDDLTQIYPSSEGKAGDATSGFQTNLLQESANSVHAPDIREDELAIEMLARKIRRMMKLLYTAPRLLNITGPNGAPEVFEFSQAAIDEYAEVRIQVGSMLPDLKSAKISMAMQMFEKGMLGDPHDPSVIRRAMELTEMGGLEVVSEEARRDEDQAYQENQVTTQGQPTPAAQWYEDHPTHVRVHQDELKTPEAQNWPPMTKHLKFAHIVTHYDFLNPPLAIALRQQYSLTDVPIASPPPPPPPLVKIPVTSPASLAYVTAPSARYVVPITPVLCVPSGLCSVLIQPSTACLTCRSASSHTLPGSLPYGRRISIPSHLLPV